MHQFMIEPLFGTDHWQIGGYNIAFTNSSLFMILVLATIWVFMLGGMKRELVPGRWQAMVEGVNARAKPQVATGGVFHLTLDRDVPVQMLRIALPAGTDIYPEISGSHYRCSIRFLVWQDAKTRPVQTTEDVAFTLSTCT